MTVTNMTELTRIIKDDRKPIIESINALREEAENKERINQREKDNESYMSKYTGHEAKSRICYI